MTTRITLSLFKYVEGNWEESKHGIREDFERIELAFNRAIAGLGTDITDATSGDTPIDDILPVAMLLSGAGSAKKTTTTASEDALAAAMLLMGAGPRQRPPDDPFPPALFLGGM